MVNINSFFSTQIYRADLREFGDKIDQGELTSTCLSTASDDEAGQKWSEDNNFAGYTSYASLNDLDWRYSIFKDLIKILNKHVKTFVKDLEFDLNDKKIKLDSLWINILPFGGIHTSHLHPHSVISGTTYISMPKGTSAIKFEDPRLAMMMASPFRKENARPELKNFIYMEPKLGEVLLWESWLRHEVQMNMADKERISVSFNYNWS
jgi:uncharacterized protein (TIGR02466 family)